MKLQYSVPYRISRKKSRPKWLWPLLIVGIFCLCLVVIISITFFRKKVDYFEERDLYLVYVDKSDKTFMLESTQDLVKKLGGAGVVYKYHNTYHLVTSFYLDVREAKEIATGLAESYQNAGILTLKVDKISRSARNTVSNNHYALEFLKNLYHLTNDMQEDSMKYLSGNLAESDLCRNLLKEKLKFQELLENISEIKSEDTIFESLYESNARLLEYIDSFFDRFYQSSKKRSLVCELGLNIAIEYFELFNNL